MEVHIKPFGITTMPHACLLGLAGAWPSLAVHVLGQADVGDTGSILTDEVDMRVEDGGVHRFAVFTQNYGDQKPTNQLYVIFSNGSFQLAVLNFFLFLNKHPFRVTIYHIE